MIEILISFLHSDFAWTKRQVEVLKEEKIKIASVRCIPKISEPHQPQDSKFPFLFSKQKLNSFPKSNQNLPLMPALFSKASIRPKASQAFWTEAPIEEPSLVTSSSTATARRGGSAFGGRFEWVRLLISSQRDLSRSTRRAAATILQPALARLRQNSLPRPEEAPVTMTTLPSRSCHGSRWFATWDAINAVESL